MKKLFLVAALALFGAMNAQTFGLKAGMNVASVSNVPGSSSKIGFNAGAFMNAPIATDFSIQPEVLYNYKGVAVSGGDLNLSYISVPVMFQYNALPQLYLEAGPEFSLLVAANAKGGGSSVDIKEAMNTFDIGIGIGAGYYFTQSIGATVRYVAGLTNVWKDSAGSDSGKNGVFQVGLAYKFAK
mgnify:CR=1 FL=1